MHKYTNKERAEIVEDYFKRNENLVSTQREFSSRNKNSKPPSRSTIESLVDEFRRTGSCHDDKESMKTKERSARIPEIIDQALALHESVPSTSTRRMALDLEISQSSVQRIRRKDLGLHPYKIQTFQTLEPRDIEKRMIFASEICEDIDRKKLDPKKIPFTDEAHFHLDGYVNKQYYRIRGSEKPAARTKPLHPERVTTWAGISGKGVVGPVFPKEGGYVDRRVYNRILKEGIPEAREKGMVDGFHFQQDGAPPHRTSENLEYTKITTGES